MKRLRTRLFSIAMAFAMLIGLLPVTALAAEGSAASINGAEYATLAEAFAAVKDEAVTVTLLRDTEVPSPITIAEGKTVTLDMQGHKISVSNDFSGRVFVNNGTFIIQGNGTIDVTAAGQNGYGSVNNFGTLTVSGGTYTNPKASDASNFYNRSGGTATFENAAIYGGGGCIATAVNTITTIHGGYYEDETYPAIENRGNMLITGGTFVNTSCSSCDSRWGYTVRSGESSANAYLKIQGAAEDSVKVTGVQGGLAVVGGTADIYNGVYKTTACKVHTTGASAFYAGYFTGESYKTATTIYGGTFQSCSKTAVLVGNGNPAPDSGAGKESTVMIKGGTYIGGDTAKTAITVNKSEYAVGAANITGGTFSSNVAQYMADDHKTIQRGDQWVVGTLDELAVAEVNGQKYLTLTEALDAAADGQTVKLLADSTGNTKVAIRDGRKLTLDLNGFHAGFAKNQNISIYQGGMDVIGRGKLYEEQPNYAPLMLYGSNDPQASNYTTVTVGKDVTLEGWSGLFIDQLSSNSGGVNAFGIQATIHGTLHSVKDTAGYGGHALYVNGVIQAAEGNVPEIILDGAVLNTDLGNGMYLAGYAKTTITDSTITSIGTDSTGIEIRAGELTINGNTTVRGGTGVFSAEPNGNGSTTGNVALAVVQHTTKQPTVVTINGGTFSGGAALFEQNAQNNDAEAVAKIQISVHNGTFKGQLYSENKTDFIDGGHFAQPVDSKYLDNRLNTQLKSISNPEAPYSYYTSTEEGNAAAKPGDVVSPVQTTPSAATYTVTLNYNDGQTANQTYTETENSFISLPTPTRSGYTFQGWYAGSTKVSSPYKVTGDVTLTAQWSLNSSSGGSSSSGDYQVTVDSGKNGKVTVSPSHADKGDTVTITVKPNDGYQLDKLTVTDKNGNTVKLTCKGSNKYTFTMPASKVTVEASFAKASSPVDSFLDVRTGAWYYDAVKYAVENGLMSGTGTYTFEPNTTLSRGMIAQMLYALEGKPSISSANNFTDVSSSDWYDKAASWAQSKGIITGYEDGRFGPNDPLTREQLALILYNYAKSEGHSTSTKADLSKFADGTSTSPWAQQAMSWAVGEGLLSGRGVNMLYPTGTATRAEVAQIMMNFCENVAK